MDQQDLIKHIGAGWANERTVRGLFLAGSHGRGTADAFSDVDLVALVDAGDHSDVAAKWRRLLEGITPVVFWNERGSDTMLLNAITEEWLRCDLFIMPPAGFVGRARDTVKPLVDRDGYYDALPATLPPRTPNIDRVRFLINEFIRVLGLLPVALGRGEHVTAAVGAGLQREHLTSLLLEDVTTADCGGALHLGTVLPADQMAMLAGLPYPKPDRGELIAAHLEIARQFLPRARALAARLDIAWPEAFEAATRRRLQRQLGTEADISW